MKSTMSDDHGEQNRVIATIKLYKYFYLNFTFTENTCVPSYVLVKDKYISESFKIYIFTVMQLSL